MPHAELLPRFPVFHDPFRSNLVHVRSFRPFVLRDTWDTPERSLSIQYAQHMTFLLLTYVSRRKTDGGRHMRDRAWYRRLPS